MPSPSVNGRMASSRCRQATWPLITQYSDPAPTIASMRFGTMRVVWVCS